MDDRSSGGCFSFSEQVCSSLLTHPKSPSGDNPLKQHGRVTAPPVAHNAGATFKDCDACPEMVALPAGEFRMGSPPDEEGRSFAEGPQRMIRFTMPFAIGRYRGDD